MKHKLIILLISILYFQISISKAQKFDIALFFQSNITSLTLAPDTGSYVIFADTNIIKLNNSDVIAISIVNDSLLNIKTLGGNIGDYKTIKISGIGKINTFNIKPTEPNLPQRTYDDGVLFRTKYDKIEIINQVDLDNYLAGVVETEGGPKGGLEFYKTHAIISRTYAFENIEKHLFEGFNLCDGVHCQAYKGKSVQNQLIIDATKSTHDLVIIDTSMHYITATFHSNCGGQSELSENVWLSSKPYFAQEKDTFCTQKRNARWKKEIPALEWKKYLEQFGVQVPTTNYAQSFTFNQYNRKKYYEYGGKKLLLKDIRADWKLRSTFFSIKVVGNKLILNGKGYGHGVGLCQEGAMHMDELGYKYEDIINKYYKNVQIVTHSSLKLHQKEKTEINQEEN